MSRLGKGLLIGFVVLLLLIAAGITFTIGWRPFFGPDARTLTDRKFESTRQRLERGKYIATALSGCIYCHSPHGWKAPGTPVEAGMEGAGAVEPYADLPGKIVAPNLTPDKETGAGDWTDDQLARAIREGIGHDGRALFPVMPYPRFREMSDEDLASVVVYLRSLPAVRHELPNTEIIFPVKYLIRSVPKPLTSAVPDVTPDAGPVRYGAHLVNLAGCGDCHTPQVQGQNVPGMDFAGGQPFPGPWPMVASANITPDNTGIAGYTDDSFLQVIRTGSVNGQVLSDVMPTMIYKNLTDTDLKAMFAYLRTLKPVQHRVDNSAPPTACKLCRQRHGGGDKN
ncbi:MAG TPA: c-type cytochrome [Candidatus Eisenbacteria bacterium]|nr:c-type cytochrome [Candidatus Eisenbacteria bacterium]